MADALPRPAAVHNQHEHGVHASAQARFGRRSFTAYTYLGELPSGAFGFNNDGVAFTLNW
eukprot:4695480-Pleurochrysis_carterae.AAC.3